MLIYTNIPHSPNLYLCFHSDQSPNIFEGLLVHRVAAAHKDGRKAGVFAFVLFQVHLVGRVARNAAVQSPQVHSFALVVRAHSVHFCTNGGVDAVHDVLCSRVHLPKHVRRRDVPSVSEKVVNILVHIRSLNFMLEHFLVEFHLLHRSGKRKFDEFGDLLHALRNACGVLEARIAALVELVELVLAGHRKIAEADGQCRGSVVAVQSGDIPFENVIVELVVSVHGELHVDFASTVDHSRFFDGEFVGVLFHASEDQVHHFRVLAHAVGCPNAIVQDFPRLGVDEGETARFDALPTELCEVGAFLDGEIEFGKLGKNLLSGHNGLPKFSDGRQGLD